MLPMALRMFSRRCGVSRSQSAIVSRMRGGALVDRVSGSYTNVVGLPLAEVVAAVRALAS